ncbi:S-methyl-5-thioribose kinase [Benzoatithermus flavus]|uniref:S-methyl-5-thioribose kinase n=1 Tax=Benzoatithermus flavus TaxID=3108223 RepID=A0ABU8XPX7_9PROT
MALSIPEGYRALDDRTLAAYLAGLPAIRRRLGGDPESWRVSEVGDGNLNLVFIVEGPDGDICVKQALPYVRLVGESWPLDLKRAWFEHQAAVIQSRHAPRQIPEVLHYDEKLYLFVMERCHPHVIMRRGMIEGVVYPTFAEQIAEYLAKTLYFTSDMALPAAEKKEIVAAFCGNTELCKITEDLIFTDPYMICDRNRWTSPQLDDAARTIREDAELKRAVSALKLKFMSETQALLHGDLHTGSIMVTEDDTKVIDPEFAFVGPMGFDVGKLIGNLLMSFFSQRGHECRPGEREAYRRWILATAEQVWSGFEKRFVELWTSYPTGDAYPRALFDGSEGRASLRIAQAAYMRRLFEDALGYAGTSMIRRTLGLAHNADMERIADPDLRASCERRNLELARDLIVNARAYPDIAAVTARAAAIEAAAPR